MYRQTDGGIEDEMQYGMPLCSLKGGRHNKLVTRSLYHFNNSMNIAGLM